MICSACHRSLAGHLQECFEEVYHDSSRGLFPQRTHHPTLQSLQRSVDEKCWPCSTFWFSIAPEQRDAICEGELSSRTARPEATWLLTASIRRFGPKDLMFTMSLSFPMSALQPTGGLGHSRSFKIHQETNFHFPNLGRLNSSTLSCSTESPETLSLAKDWIDSCLKSHSRCNSVPQAQSVWYPTRLLDSGSLDANDTPKIKLIETAVTAIDGPYMTLSHSWGKGHSLTLNKKSYRMLLDGVTPLVLPQTFREASNVARRLGVRFVWIDALCIFQDKDDLSDWNKEASLMHKVYAHSLCNIVAAETADSSHSMFASRDPATMLPAYSEECIDIHLGGARITHKYILTDEDSKKEVENARINTRAWVMQERYMSPRSLHFGCSQLFWECREAEAAETNASGITLGEPGLKSQFEDVRDYLDKKSPAGTCDAEPGHVGFYHLVSEYSKCAPNLSFHSDKLIAFSAILKNYSTVHNGEIVAGMRRRCLESDLLWIRTHDSNESILGPVDVPACYGTYIAPSWSWASVRGSVSRDDRPGERTLIHVEDYKLDHVTEDTTGAIRGGWLRLSGLLKPVKLLRFHDLFICQTEDDRVREIFEPRGSHHHESSAVLLDSWMDNFEQDNNNRTLFCMAATEKHDDSGKYSTGSLLLKLVDSNTGTFRRLGMVWRMGEQASHLLTANDGSDYVDAKPGMPPCIEYKNGRHSIYII